MGQLWFCLGLQPHVLQAPVCPSLPSIAFYWDSPASGQMLQLGRSGAVFSTGSARELALSPEGGSLPDPWEV